MDDSTELLSGARYEVTNQVYAVLSMASYSAAIILSEYYLVSLIISLLVVLSTVDVVMLVAFIAATSTAAASCLSATGKSIAVLRSTWENYSQLR